MSVNFQDAVSHGISLKYSSISLADISTEELRLVIHDLNTVSDQLGCVVFEGRVKSKTDLIIFAGNLERFSMLSAAREIASRIFYFQDTTSWWYGGSNMLPDIKGIASFLWEYVRGRQCLAFGQSSGGYAALAVGGLIPHCDVLACSPQTFPDSSLKRRLHIAPSLAVQHAPDHLLDLEKIYATSRRSGVAAAIFSASEFSNPYQSHFWLDHLHLAKIAPVQSIDIFIAASANHSIVFQRARMFSECLKELLAVNSKKADVKRAVIRNFVKDIQQSESTEG